MDLFCNHSFIIGNLLFQNQGILDFFWQTFSHHWKFTVSVSRNFGFFSHKSFFSSRNLLMDLRNFGFFCLNIFLSSKKLLIGFREYWIFSAIILSSLEICYFRIKEFWISFLTTVFSHPGQDLRNFGFLLQTFFHLCRL